MDTFAHIVLAAANAVTMIIVRADDPATAFAAEENAFTDCRDRLLGYPATPTAQNWPHRDGTGRRESLRAQL